MISFFDVIFDDKYKLDNSFKSNASTFTRQIFYGYNKVLYSSNFRFLFDISRCEFDFEDKSTS